MLNFVLLAGLSIIQAPEPKFDIVSDFDDTIKISDVPNFFSMLLDGLFSRKVFTGTRELMTELVAASNETLTTSAPEQNFLVISAGAPFLGPEIRSALKKFPPYFLRLRNWVTESNMRTYKVKVLNEKLVRPAILMGDDTEHDPEAYEDFQKQKPNLVLATYIHRVTGKPVVKPGQKKWITAFDIAYSEFQEKRLSADQVLNVASAILNLQKKEFSSLIPRYARFGCADHDELACGFTKDAAVEYACQKVFDRVGMICKGFSKQY